MKWSDHESNKEEVTPAQHTFIHNKLNIPHDHIRDFRRRTNERTIRDGERSATYHKIRKLYFANLDKLDEELLFLHNRSFSKQVSRASKQIYYLLADKHDIEKHKLEPWLLDYHNLENFKHWELVEAVERKLFNLMKLDKRRNDLFINYYVKNIPPLDTNFTAT